MKPGNKKMTKAGSVTRCGEVGDGQDDVAMMVARFQKSRVDADEADSAQGKRDAAAWVRETPEMVELVARLKKSKDQAGVADMRQGRADGRDWAINRAEWRHLEALHQISCEFTDEDMILREESPGTTLIWELSKALLEYYGETHTPDALQRAMFFTTVGFNVRSYIVSYVKAAMEVYETIEEAVG